MRRLVCWIVTIAGCAASHSAPNGVVSAPAPGAPAMGRPAPAVPVSAAPSPVAPPPVTAESTATDFPVLRALAIPVSSIALGEGSRIAVLADPPYLGDARAMQAVPLPNVLRPKSGEVDDLRIFFGRDNEPRVMGTRHSGTSEMPVYWRHTSAGWRDGREEIGQLGSATRGGLWGVLGGADPELVCRAGSVCIIKRTSGWTTAPAGPAPRIVELQGGTLWGLDASGLANIDAHGWAVAIAAPAWSEPRAFWATAAEAWVATERELFRYHDGAWSNGPAPIAEPAAFWGARPDSIWLVGKGGAAHFDGHGWRRLSVAGPLGAVTGRSESELWFGGSAGLLRSRR